MQEQNEKLEDCGICGTVLSYEWEVDVCKDCLNRFKDKKELS